MTMDHTYCIMHQVQGKLIQLNAIPTCILDYKYVLSIFTKNELGEQSCLSRFLNVFKIINHKCRVTCRMRYSIIVTKYNGR